jgi:hypothetical protein
MVIIWPLTIGIIIWLSIISFLVLKIYRHPATSAPPHSPGHLRFSIVRFNPFSDTGGEQSFVVSLLDGGGNGILLTSLHGRGMTRIYAKRVIAGKTDQELSTEENTALSQALNNQHE